jgi:AcrR family transcriptional regulator
LNTVFDCTIVVGVVAVNNQTGALRSLPDTHRELSWKPEEYMERGRPDRRVERTRQLLREALLSLILERGYAGITVQHIIDRANVGRSTFYAHFRDREDLLLSELKGLRAAVQEQIKREPVESHEDARQRVSLILFKHAQASHQVYKALFGTRGSEVALADVRRLLAAIMHDYVKSILPRVKKLAHVDAVVQSVVGSFLALLTWWLDNDLPLSAEEMDTLFTRLTTPGATNVLGGKR